MTKDLTKIFDIEVNQPESDQLNKQADRAQKPVVVPAHLRNVREEYRDLALFSCPKYIALCEKTTFTGDDLDKLIRCLNENGGYTDLVISSENFIVMKHKKVIHRLLTRPISHDEVKRMVEHMYSADVYHHALEPGQDVDPSYSVDAYDYGEIPEHGIKSGKEYKYPYRSRVNISSFQTFRGRGVKVTHRSLPPKPPTYDELNVSALIRKYATPRDGLVVVCGETGSGKSTLVASIIHALHTNIQDPRFILTYEKPIEFVFYHSGGYNPVWQNEIGEFGDFKTFHQGLVNALRNGPEVIYLGESREPETFVTLPKIAESGHLGITTMHARSISNIFTRAANEVGGNKIGLIRQMIQYMQLGVYQWLAPTKDGGVAPVQEVLYFSEEIKDAILSCEDNHLITKVDEMVQKHGQSLEQHAKELLTTDIITPRTFHQITNKQVA
ncbi:ATPase, T2SS/T4P/T4SS family [Vibrio mediterranei]|uniref:ATPase, T2SS/T4P/T4SS family n=1 Tax=Vibrio mediterranei TaxID=689 RepID=UPI0038CE2F6C